MPGVIGWTDNMDGTFTVRFDLSGVQNQVFSYFGANFSKDPFTKPSVIGRHEQPKPEM